MRGPWVYALAVLGFSVTIAPAAANHCPENDNEYFDCFHPGPGQMPRPRLNQPSNQGRVYYAPDPSVRQRQEAERRVWEAERRAQAEAEREDQEERRRERQQRRNERMARDALMGILGATGSRSSGGGSYGGSGNYGGGPLVLPGGTGGGRCGPGGCQ